jgi:hypothetical protein
LNKGYLHSNGTNPMPDRQVIRNQLTKHPMKCETDRFRYGDCPFFDKLMFQAKDTTTVKMLH